MPSEAPRPSLIDLNTPFLPVGQMRQIARVTELAGPSIAGEVDLGPEHWAFAQHLPGDPVFPGSLIVEAAGQLVALWAWASGQRGRPRYLRANAEFRLPVGRAEPAAGIPRWRAGTSGSAGRSPRPRARPAARPLRR